jgi:IMP dehydrogenase
VIEHPLWLERSATIAEARLEIRRHNASSFLIEETKGSHALAGLLSHRDMPLDTASDARPVSEFMTPRARLVTRPPSVSLEEAERAMFEHRVEKLPLVDEGGRLHGLVTMRDLKLYKQKPHSTKDARGRPARGRGGRRDGGLPARADALVEQEVDVLLLDVAHADAEVVERAVRQLRQRSRACRSWSATSRPPRPRAGSPASVSTRSRSASARDAAAGRGWRPGAGVPQLQAVRECYLATEGRVPVIADGGVRDDKDLFLAIACGASTVMLGSLLSGTDEAPGMIVEDPATRQKR